MSEWQPEILGRYTLRGFEVVAVRAPRELPRDSTGLIGTLVVIDGEVRRIKGVERTALGRPIRAGEDITLMLETST